MTMRMLVDELIEAWKSGDAVRASAFFALDGEYVESGREPIRGREAIQTHFQRFFRDGPNWRLDVDAVVAEADLAAVAYRFSIKGDRDEWGERVGCAFVARRDGLIARWREYQG